MINNTKCSGEGCYLSKNCVRFSSEEDRFAQKWFISVPGKKERGKWVCHKFINSNHVK